MSKIAEIKAFDRYPKDRKGCLYDMARNEYIKGYDQAIQDMVKDSDHLKYLSDEMGYAYACGCRKTMQDFMEKACTFLKNRTMAELCLDSESTELVDDFIEDFKNHMQNE